MDAQAFLDGQPPASLPPEAIAAYEAFMRAADDDPVIPHPLPGGGKRWSALTRAEADEFAAVEVAYEDLDYEALWQP
jgi:hypothetical protein